MHLILVSLFVFSFVGLQPDLPVLTESMLKSSGGRFVIQKDYTLLGKTLIMPSSTTLVFDGGSVNNGRLIGNHSFVEVNQTKPAFGIDIVIEGIWNTPEVHDGWFAFDKSPQFVSNQLINNILSFSNDMTPCHVFFEEDRTYYFELPYKGRADLGNLVTDKVVDGKKKRNYEELYNDDFSFLRIFTIPSNTHLTVNNTLKMLPTNQGAYFVFWEYRKENVVIDGHGEISGENDWHIYNNPFLGKQYYGEWGFVFRCLSCHNFTIKDITISDAFGDCLYYSGSYYPNDPNPRWASYLTLNNVKVLRARRNGVAIGARNVRIQDCYFEGCGTNSVKGTAPRSAIDFEPDYVIDFPTIGNQDVIMEKCIFVNNYIDVASSVNNLPGYGKIATTIRNCQFSSRVKISSTYWFRFERCYIPYLSKRKDNLQYYSKHIEFVNCDFGEDSATVLGLFSKKTNIFTNCRFNIVNNK